MSAKPMTKGDLKRVLARLDADGVPDDALLLRPGGGGHYPADTVMTVGSLVAYREPADSLLEGMYARFRFYGDQDQQPERAVYFG